MKKIILFEGDIETQGYFSRQMARTLKQLGHEVLLYDLSKPWSSSSKLLRFIERGNTVVLAFNFHGMCQEAQFIDEERQVYIWDDLEIPCFNILADHPYYYYKLLAQRPRRYVQLSIDKGHEAFMKRFFPEIKLGLFLPLAGTDLATAVRDGHENEQTRLTGGKIPPIDERPVDLIFTGNYASPKRFEKYITRLDEEYTAFYYEMIHDLLAHPDRTVEEVVEHYLRREIEDLSEEDLKETMQNITFIDLYVRYHIRGEMIRALTDGGIVVHVYGDKWNELKLSRPENLIDGDSVYSVECLEKIAQSKISLNILPWFRGGPHDRIFNSMLCKSVCLTDSNPWLEHFLRDGENCRIYSPACPDRLPEIVREILSDPAGMQRMADAGYESAAQQTWDARMRSFSNWLENEWKS
ncbi:MAG: glycosyltransferase [Lachnospiraceae bacterium]|nr:glycosyltransferase [Lachnospiraceae bacterium]